MLSQQNRLKRTEEINQVFRRGKGFHSPFFSAKYTFREGNVPSRLAFSFGKKYLLKAVARNRLKRLIIAELQQKPDFFELGVEAVFFLANHSNIYDKKGFQVSVESFLQKVYNGGKPEK